LRKPVKIFLAVFGTVTLILLTVQVYITVRGEGSELACYSRNPRLLRLAAMGEETASPIPSSESDMRTGTYRKGTEVTVDIWVPRTKFEFYVFFF
jgi:hypothetical protein